MKKILFTLALLISLVSYGQKPTYLGDLYLIYPNGIEGYDGINGETLFEGKATQDNINSFINHSDFKKIDHYTTILFKGELIESDKVIIKYYCDVNGIPVTMKSFLFTKWDEGDKEQYLTGTKIEYDRDGSINSITHH